MQLETRPAQKLAKCIPYLADSLLDSLEIQAALTPCPVLLHKQLEIINLINTTLKLLSSFYLEFRDDILNRLPSYVAKNPVCGSECSEVLYINNILEPVETIDSIGV